MGAVVQTVKNQLAAKGVVDVDADADPQDNTSSDTYNTSDLLAVCSALLVESTLEAACTM